MQYAILHIDTLYVNEISAIIEAEKTTHDINKLLY